MGEVMDTNSKSLNKRRVNQKKLVKFIIVFVVVFYTGWTLIAQQFQIEANKAKLTQVDGEIKKQQELRQQLSEKKAIVNTPEYIEKVAREKLDLAKPDEIIFIDATVKK